LGSWQGKTRRRRNSGALISFSKTKQTLGLIEEAGMTQKHACFGNGRIIVP
jgi:hypothetical protein